MSVGRRSSARPAAMRRGPGHSGYLEESRRPLTILVFLLPLIVLYELGSIFYLNAAGAGQPADPLIAKGILHALFDRFGGVSLHLPAVTLVVVLALWHLIERGPWRVRPAVLGVMWLESAVWTIPLLVLWLVVATGQPAAAAATPDGVAGLPWQARLTLSVGAGLYEELVFRLILITAIHFVAVDLVRLNNDAGHVLAAVISAVVFALFHDVRGPTGGVDVRLLIFFLASGLLLAGLFVLRGFGIVAGAHAVYDVLALVLITRAEA
jgi:membrane protease YdiL (CAAX protease family)